MEIIDKIVDFTKCKECQNVDTPEGEDPCHECLNNSVLPYTTTPLNFKKKEVEKK